MIKSSLQDLYLVELRVLMNAENQLVETLPKVIEASDTPEFREEVAGHLAKTKGHVDRLNQLILLLGGKAEENRADYGDPSAQGEFAETTHDLMLFVSDQGQDEYASTPEGLRIMTAQMDGYDYAANI